MELPESIELPIFVYGLFKPGQLGYYRIEDEVQEESSALIEGALRERDGVPILVEDPSMQVEGHLLRFRDGGNEEAYQSIADLEPEKQYRWVEREIALNDEPVRANVLLGKKPGRGSDEYMSNNWDGSDDPLFSDALELVDEVQSDVHTMNDGDYKPFFRLHMAYLLLWSSIERYATLKYGLRSDILSDDIPSETKKRRSIRSKLVMMGNESAFKRGLKEEILPNRVDHCIYRADRPGDSPKRLDPDDPKQAIDYYYQVRSNLTHRGKSAYTDFTVLQSSLDELYSIFTSHVLAEQFERWAQS